VRNWIKTLKGNTCENQPNELNVTNNLNAPNSANGEELNCPSSHLRPESEINVPEEMNGQADLVQQTQNNV
jgi:hypothetical protein